MPIAEWEAPMTLVSPLGNLTLNDKTNPDGLFQVAVAGQQGLLTQAASGTGLRVTSDPVPQGDGTIWHDGFVDGYGLIIPINYWVDNQTLAGNKTTPTAQEMDDTLMRHIRSMISGGGRLLYTPAGIASRLADRLQAAAAWQLIEAAGITGTTIQLGSPFPYMMDFDQTLTSLSSGSPTATLTNGGTAPYFPVFKVYGPFDTFTLENTTTGLQIIYDSSLPGAVSVGSGHYVEISTFENTVYLDGSGASRKAGIDIQNSEFWTLEVGDNDVEITSGGTAPDVDILWQNAWI